MVVSKPTTRNKSDKKLLYVLHVPSDVITLLLYIYNTLTDDCRYHKHSIACNILIRITTFPSLSTIIISKVYGRFLSHFEVTSQCRVTNDVGNHDNVCVRTNDLQTTFPAVPTWGR